MRSHCFEIVIIYKSLSHEHLNGLDGVALCLARAVHGACYLGGRQEHRMQTLVLVHSVLRPIEHRVFEEPHESLLVEDRLHSTELTGNGLLEDLLSKRLKHLTSVEPAQIVDNAQLVAPDLAIRTEVNLTLVVVLVVHSEHGELVRIHGHRNLGLTGYAQFTVSRVEEVLVLFGH